MPSNALDYVTIIGFKSIASLEKLKLGPINIVIGPNGSGKSNFTGAFSFLHAIREGRLQDYVTAAGGAERLLYFGSKTTKEISFHLSFEDQVPSPGGRRLPIGGIGLATCHKTPLLPHTVFHEISRAAGPSQKAGRPIVHCE